FVGVTRRVGNFHVAFDYFGVPDLVQVGRIIFALGAGRIEARFMAKVFHGHAITAVVGVGDGMERLMHIADKVDEVADRFATLGGISGLVFQNGALFFDCARHAAFGAA